jgi:hypothetical protein
VNAIIPFGALALGVILYTLFHPSLRRQTDLGPEGEPPIDAPDGVEAPAPAATSPPAPIGAGHGPAPQ